MKRSEFFKLSLAATAAAGLPAAGVARAAVQDQSGPLPRRPYGKTGEMLSIIGFGGIVVNGGEQAHADQVVREAFEAGVNYFDVAPTYGDGEAEQKLGPALEPFRKQVFLACKTTERSAAGAREELERSLRRLRTDHFDLYQLHAIQSREDIEQAFGPGGAMETFIKAREQGKVRYLGFSAHSVEAALAAIERFDFNSALIPVNWGCWYKGNFGPQVIDKALEKDMAVLALKPGAHSRLEQGQKPKYSKCWYTPHESEQELERSYRFTFSLPVTAAIPPGEEHLFRMALRLAPRFIPVSEEEKRQLAVQAEEVARPLFSYPAWKS